jgi:hypothetical protein
MHEGIEVLPVLSLSKSFLKGVNLDEAIIETLFREKEPQASF